MLGGFSKSPGNVDHRLIADKSYLLHFISLSFIALPTLTLSLGTNRIQMSNNLRCWDYLYHDIDDHMETNNRKDRLNRLRLHQTIETIPTTEKVIWKLGLSKTILILFSTASRILHIFTL